MSNPPAKRVAVHTLGCKLNYAETSTLAEQLVLRGFQIVPFGESADILLLNTCSVTENAEKECRQLIRRQLRTSPNAFVAVTGCYAQLRPQEIAGIEGVDLVLGAQEKFDLLDSVADFEKRNAPLVLVTAFAETPEFHSSATSESDSRTRAFLKVQDGCDYSCSYCTIPEARGVSRSGTIEQIVSEAIRLSEEGFREIVLSGVNVGDFGSGSPQTFYDLARALDEEPRITARLRISSIEPNLLKNEIIELVARSQKWCPHFHLPLQSGSPKILRLMQRRYNRDLYADRVATIRALMPEAAIGVDVIVGFPGEGEREFEETFDYMTALDVTYFHVFTYSERPGTKAVMLPDFVPVPHRRERNHRLRSLSEMKLHQFYRAQAGSVHTALFERRRENAEYVEGYTENYVRVKVAHDAVRGAELARVRLVVPAGGAMIADVVDVLAESQREELLPIL